MGQDRLKSSLMSAALALSATLSTFYVAIVVESLLQPEPRPEPFPTEIGVQENDRDWSPVNDWRPSLKDLYTMTNLVIPEAPSRRQLLRADRR